ncbi:MAG: hypothetical protein PHS60_18350, partial [Zavarzinia sp.]|nr:hypothetical protein [Zavarzinia sp.]
GQWRRRQGRRIWRPDPDAFNPSTFTDMIETGEPRESADSSRCEVESETEPTVWDARENGA